jgi:hypothetical protein
MISAGVSRIQFLRILAVAGRARRCGPAYHFEKAKPYKLKRVEESTKKGR